MKTLGNILWHIPFLGFINAIFVYVIGLILTATVIAAPIGLGLMEFGKFLFWPFGHAMISKKELKTKSSMEYILNHRHGIVFSVRNSSCYFGSISGGWIIHKYYWYTSSLGDSKISWHILKPSK